MQLKLMLNMLVLIAPHLLLLLLLLVSPIQSTPMQKQLPGMCNKIDGGIFMPMRGNCAGFYMCINGRVVAATCGQFYRFNTAKGICDHPDSVKCEENEALGVLEEYEDAVLPGFPAHLPKPLTPEEAIIDEAAGAICVSEENGVLLPKPDSCAHFYVCLQQRPYRRTCPPMLHFNAETHLCQDPAIAQCMPKGFVENPYALELAKNFGDNDVWNCVGMPDGILLPHDDSCEKFVRCEAGERFGMECPEGLHFSVRHQRCEWPKLARCMV